MPVLRLMGFTGEIPRLQPRMLPDRGAQNAQNVRLKDGSLTPINVSRIAHRFSEWAGDTIGSIYLHMGKWHCWEGAVDAAPGPVAHDRLYLTGDGKPKLVVGEETYALAVPAPTARLTFSVVGKATESSITTRIYTYTYVTEFGEESEPAPASLEVDWRPGQRVVLSNFMRPADTSRGITKQRIYRSVTGTSGGTEFYLIAERDLSVQMFTDDFGADEFAEALPSLDWNPPIDDLNGLISLHSGMMAAFKGKDLYFCEPWHPHAWPEKYVLTTDYDIVALGAFGTSIVILTTGQPYIASGLAPEQMAMERVEVNLPCINPRSVVDLGYSVVYASTDGLVSISASGAQIISRNLVTTEEWKTWNPVTFVSGQKDGRYYASYEYVDDDSTVRLGAFLIDLSGETPYLIRTNEQAKCAHYDIPGSTLYLLRGNAVYEFDAHGAMPHDMIWRSKHIVLQPWQESFSCIYVPTVKVTTEQQMKAKKAEVARVVARNQARLPFPIEGELNGSPFNGHAVNGDILEPIPQLGEAVIRIYVDTKLVFSTDRLNSIERMTAGYRGEVMEIEVQGTAHIAEIRLATSMEEIAQVQ